MSFDRLARHYRWLEPLLAGDVLRRARRVHLARLVGRRQVLLLGEGPGETLLAAMDQLPWTQFTVVDSSAAMLALACRRVAARPDAHRVRWHHATLPDDLPVLGSDYDAVITACFLDCFAPDGLARLIAGVARLCTPDATWLVVDFALPAHGWRRWRARFAHRLMYAFFRATTRIPARRWTDPSPFLRRAGFDARARRAFQHGLVDATLWTRAAQGSAFKAPALTMELSR